MSQALASLLWRSNGERRVPPAAALDREISKLRRGQLEKLCELNPQGPIYLIPTRPFLRALAARIRACGARRVLEVAAGDGHLGRSLAALAPDLRVTMTDSGAWQRPQARMSAREKRQYRRASISGITLPPDVQRLEARAAIRKYRPDLVLASWLPPGPALARIIKSPVRQVLEIGAGSGITGDISCWRFPHQFCEGKLEESARCRLDGKKRHSRVTFYLGAAHPEFVEERGHWLSTNRQ